MAYQKIARAAVVEVRAHWANDGEPLQTHYYAWWRKVTPITAAALTNLGNTYARWFLYTWQAHVSTGVSFDTLTIRSLADYPWLTVEIDLRATYGAGRSPYQPLPRAMAAVAKIQIPGHIGRTSRNRMYLFGTTVAAYDWGPPPAWGNYFVAGIGGGWDYCCNALGAFQWQPAVISWLDRTITPIDCTAGGIPIGFGWINHRGVLQRSQGH